MAYRDNEGYGKAWKNKRWENPSQPTYTGNVTTPSGERLSISIWTKTADKTGAEYFEIWLKKPYVKPEQTPAPAAAPEVQSNNNGDDDLPY